MSRASLTVALFLTSIAGGLLGTSWWDQTPGTTYLWVPSGLALAAFLILGYRVWPVVAVAALAVALITVGPSLAAPFVAAGRTIEPLLAAYLVNRYANGRHAPLNPRDSVRFSGLVILTAFISSATITAVTLVVAGFAPAEQYGVTYLAQGLGSAVAMLLIAPPIVLFSRGRPRLSAEQIAEGILAFGVVTVTTAVGFFEFPVEMRGFPVELLLMPALLWPALRLGRRATATSLLIVAAIALAGTLAGYGPFVRSTPIVSLVIVLLFVAALAVITLALSALSASYAVAEEQLRELVVTDPLTGLPNYRRLLQVLETEISRAGRLGREFAVIFLDMDDLKGINDQLGHLAGSRAVCRLAETLRGALREADTAARYGGDEFVAVLSDTDFDGAALVLSRLRESLRDDAATPPLSVSAGVAVYPRDGRTPTTLLATADRALYANKAQKAQARGRTVVDLQQWTSAS